MNPTILNSAMCKYSGRLVSLTLLLQTVMGKENSEFK